MQNNLINLTRNLLKIKSITPKDGGCFALIESYLGNLGFHSKRIVFYDVTNLYLKIGTGSPHLCFVGHVDTVPANYRKDSWEVHPFKGKIKNDNIYGRGAVDMKGSIACFMDALVNISSIVKKGTSNSISMLLTSDEEGLAVNGIRKAIDFLVKSNEKFDAFLVGEPTSSAFVGDVVKIGRRGSLNIEIKLNGFPGHVAYPNSFVNPIQDLRKILPVLNNNIFFDNEFDLFNSSHLEIVSIDTGNLVWNTTPKEVIVKINIRYSTNHTSNSLIILLENLLRQADIKSSYKIEIKGDSKGFYNNPGLFLCCVQDAIKHVIGKKAKIDTGGGTSDARFLYMFAPVVELGLRHETAHQINEHVSLEDLKNLSKIYKNILERFFNLNI